VSVAMAALGDVVEVRGGGTPSKANPAFWNGHIPWVSPKDMKRWEISDAEDKITSDAIENSATNLIPPNSVLVVNRSGILKHTLPVGITRREVAINQDLKALICNGRAYPEYIAHMIKAAEPIVLKWVRATTADNFSIENLRSLEIPLPPFREQRRIAAILDKADALRSKRKYAVELLENLKQSLFVEIFGDPINNPKGWRERSLADFETFLTSGSRGWAKYYSQSGKAFIRIQNLQQGELSTNEVQYVDPPDSAEARRTTVQSGDVLISITADLGRTAIVPDSLDHRAHINQHIALVRTKGINPAYLSMYLASPAGKLQFDALNRQGVKAGLNFDNIRSLKILEPPLSIQNKYVSLRTKIGKIAEVHAREARAAHLLFSSLQHRAFSGQL